MTPMTEAEWNCCTDPQPMLEFLKGNASDRKLRLFAVACCRWPKNNLLFDSVGRALEVAERFADGRATEQDLHKVQSRLGQILHKHRGNKLERRFHPTPLEVRVNLVIAASHYHVPFLIGRLAWIRREEEVASRSPGLLRHIFGNPFQPYAAPDYWQNRGPEALVGPDSAGNWTGRLPQGCGESPSWIILSWE
jgi:hypothetical protein